MHAGATAIRRGTVSRPVRIALEVGLISPERTVLDYGCGHGEDLDVLADLGVEAVGWDPVHRPDGELRPADIVNLGFVLNVIESPERREAALLDAWGYAQTALVIAVRTRNEAPSLGQVRHCGDGCTTTRGTFQRLYGQAEARDWIGDVLGVAPLPLDPGVFVVFRDVGAEQQWLDRRHRQRRRLSMARRPRQPRISHRLRAYDENRDILTRLEEFLEERGRLPEGDEAEWVEPIVEAFGSLRRAFQVIRHAASDPFWERGAEQRRAELRLELALARLRRRPRFGQLPRDMQRDVKALWGSYKAACADADELLFSVGDRAQLRRAAESTDVGKLTSEALYVHIGAVHELPAQLRIYVGCANAVIGGLEAATVLKLHLERPRVSYLVYEHFDTDPHPALAESWVVDFVSLDVSARDYRERDNPPVLHRKELLVGPDYPQREKFARLTAQEDRHGLLEDAASIGTRRGWEQRLAAAGWQLRGHRLVRARSDDGSISPSEAQRGRQRA